MNLGACHLGERSLSHQSNAPQGRPWGSGKEGGQDEGDHSRRSSTAVRSASASPTGSLGRMATRLPARTASVVPGGVQGTDSGVLALAKQQLGQLGISQPTPQQLQAALTGGPVTTVTGTTATTTQLQGVLTMRSQGMGWGQIAQKLGTKLGPVVSGLKGANQSMTTANASSTGSQSTSSSNGIVSGSGKSHVNSEQGVSGQNNGGEGIVSASGRSVGNGNAYGKGVVTGAGQGAGSSGITTAGGHGNSGYSKGQGK